MSRLGLTGLLVVALLAGSPLASAAHLPLPSRPVSPAIPPRASVEVKGVLQYMADGPGRYQVNGYLVLGLNDQQLLPLLGRNVVVRGILIDAPSIYMRRAIQAEAIQPEDLISIPAEPPYRLYFGRVEGDCEQFYLVEQETGPRTLLEGIDLSHLIGHPVAVAAEEEILSEGVRIFRVYRVFPLGEDLAPYLGTFYQQPERPIQVTLYQSPVVMEQPPVMANGRVLVGLRAIAEAMGAKVTWNEALRQVIVQRGNRMVLLRIGSPHVLTWEAGQEPSYFTTDITPVVVGGRTLVPIRVLADGLGLKVDWDPAGWVVRLW